LIQRKSYQIVRQTGLPVSDREDVEQTLALHLLTRLRQFDGAEEARPAYVRMVLRQATVNALRFLSAAKRAGGATSLDALLRNEDEREVAPGGGDDRRDTQEQFELARDVAEVLESLPAELRPVAEGLMSHSISRTARDLGMPRSTLYERVEVIRTAFEAADLRDYL
jgi:RNA polymerase sigma-70 factor (ECF subfamily)